jgi:hypothetical protein
LTVVIFVSAGALSEKPEVDESQKPQEIEARGRVVDLAARMHSLYGVAPPSNPQPLYGFETQDGVFYTLLRTALSEALFVDERLRERELIIKGRTFPKTQLLEVITTQSVHNGVVHEVYYYCETCAIRAVAPGNCECCQAPVELVEKPLKRKDRKF